MQSNPMAFFLGLLGSNELSFTFQTVPEPKGKPTKLWPQVLHGSIEELLPRLTTLNRKGAGIYVSVNATDGQGRKTSNISRVRCIWQDDDDGYSGGFPLEPSMTIATSPGKFQRYWLADGLSNEDYRGLMRTMIEDCGSDAQTGADLARVLRVPGFYHNKAEPYLVHILEASGRRYSRAELLKAFPRAQEPPRAAFVAKVARFSEESFRIRMALQHVDPDPYAQWIQIEQILHDQYDGQAEGLMLWLEWAQGSAKFEAVEHSYKWTTFGKRGGRTLGLGTLFRLANEGMYA